MRISLPPPRKIPLAGIEDGFLRSLRTSGSRCRASSAASGTSTQSISLPSRRSSSIARFVGVWCCLAMRRTRHHRTWPRVRPWRWKMRWCWPRCWLCIPRRRRPYQRSPNAGALASDGSSSEHTAGIKFGLCRVRFAISRSVWQEQPFISETIECCSRNHSSDKSI